MKLENVSVSKCSTWNFRLKINNTETLHRINLLFNPFYLIITSAHLFSFTKKIVSLFSKLSFSQRTDKSIEVFENMILIETLMFVKELN